MPGAHVHVGDCAALVEHGNLRCRGAYVDAYAYAEHVFSLRILERLTVDAVTQSGGRRVPAAAPAFGLLVIVSLGYFAASPVESLWKFE